ncbi:MAG TPA: dihydroxyacetone kinase subunit DhaK [Gaiellaceae bacterium]|nr:dihydroxyacetone kinase subunit DhaK [Gaiellaceae bacterium]
MTESPEIASAGPRRHFVNDPREIVAQALAGFERANPTLVRWNREPSFAVRASDDGPPRVGLLAGGGSGHEPLHVGFVGAGMLDAAVPGGIFASPTAMQVEAATAAIDRGRGVVHIIKNYTGDVMNFGMAAELADAEVESVLVDDDLATDSEDGPGRRGTAAVIAVEKICGAAAARGASLQEVVALGRRVAVGARSMAVALHAPTHPGQDRPSFDLPPGEIELGVGIHGERGVGRRTHAPAAELAQALLDPVAAALGLERGARVLVIVNGLGATHGLELHVMFGEVGRLLDERGIVLERALVGSYVTALDMSGCSVTLVRLDDELVELWDAPVRTPALTW